MPNNTCPKTGQLNTLADTVRIVVPPTGSNRGALVIGNSATHEFGGVNMAHSTPLRFNYVDNQVPVSDGNNNAVTAGNELAAVRGSSSVNAFGVLITSGDDTNGPKMNAVSARNAGIWTNRAIFSVGIGTND